MIERFEGVGGRRRLVESLRSQRIIQGDFEAASELAELVSLSEFPSGETLIEEGEADNDLLFVLTGKVAIVVNGRLVAERIPGEHVGEMAMIDTSVRRSASVIAAEETVVARIPEASFSPFADAKPRLWRLIAVELCDRLRQRNRLVRPVNVRPFIFIGSSVESLSFAREIQDGLQHDKVSVRLWTDKVFGASHFPVEDLAAVFDEADFGVLVVGPDDKVVGRDDEHDAPRDNVVFELGMSMGALSRQRSFIVKPRRVDLKIPSDLLGIGCLEFENVPADSADLPSAMGPVCNELRKTIAAIGCR